MAKPLFPIIPLSLVADGLRCCTITAMSLKRMIPLLLVNIVVSALVAVGLWTYLEQRSPQGAVEPVVTIVIQENAGVANSAEPAAILVPEISAADSGETAPQPTPTPAAVAEEASDVRLEAVTHVVQSGELLGNISVQYDVSVNEIVAANGLDNPNQIFVGQELIIPANSELVEAAQAAEATPAPPTAVPPEEIVTGETSLSIAAVSGAGDLNSEHIELVNIGADPIVLDGWTLTDDAGNIFTFGQATLFGGGSGLKVHTRAGENGATDLFWGGNTPVWSAGKTVIVRDTDGLIQADFVVP